MGIRNILREAYFFIYPYISHARQCFDISLISMATYYIHKRGDGKNTLMITKLYRIVNR